MSTPDDQPERIVTLVLVDDDRTVLGALEPFAVATPWWMDIAPVVEQAHQQHGVSVVVLRLLSADREMPHGGEVTYLAQVDRSFARRGLRAWEGRLDDDPRRLAYAEVGGPQADIAWAEQVLCAQNNPVVGEPTQHRTWNLSSIWSLPARSGSVWLKVGPPFFAHEGAVIAAVAERNERARGSATAVPSLLGRENARLLLADIAGSDRYHADLPERFAMIDTLVNLQRQWLGQAEALRPLGLPDWRDTALTEAITHLVGRRSPELDEAARQQLSAFVSELPERFAAIAECGIGDGLVHGDFHPGNVRGDGVANTVIDWADSGVGHPLLDQPAFFRTADEDEIAPLATHWAAAWQRAIPGCRPERAAALLAPVAAARQAVIYQGFLDRIGATKQRYHVGDVPIWLNRVVETLRAVP